MMKDGINPKQNGSAISTNHSKTPSLVVQLSQLCCYDNSTQLIDMPRLRVAGVGNYGTEHTSGLQMARFTLPMASSPLGTTLRPLHETALRRVFIGAIQEGRRGVQKALHYSRIQWRSVNFKA